VLATPLVAAYTLFAIGIVLIYRASKVLNLAHGVMAMLPAYLFHSFGQHLPMPVALVLAVASGAVLGAVIEVVFVRRLRAVSPTAQTVGTVAVYGLVVAVVAKVYGTTPLRIPGLFPDRTITFSGSGITYAQLGLIGVAGVLTVAVFALFKLTSLGLAMRGSASNRRAAALVGVDPDRTTAVAWMMGGALAAIAGVLLAGVISIDPYGFPLQALPAFVAALIGGLGSMPGALAGATIVGLMTGIVPGLQRIDGLKGFASSIGAPQAVLALLAFVVMAMRGEKLSASNVRSEGLV
jgi:branched-chain amino acid transport system permease protein